MECKINNASPFMFNKLNYYYKADTIFGGIIFTEKMNNRD
jgi:hypothetical protein